MNQRMKEERNKENEKGSKKEETKQGRKIGVIT
jgi:hypothetical protein